MDDSLFLLGTRFSAELDKSFGCKTIAAKMTDVPCHSRGIIKPMVQAGLQFLHIGVNPATTPPDVPELFRWKHPDQSEIIVMYQKDYGNVMVLPDGQTAVAISFTGDNHGPQSPEQITEIYKNLRERFPEAEVFASTLNDVAKEIIPQKGHLPVITQELGDTWIHGTGSDPLKVVRFRELSRLRRKWIGSGKLKEHDPTDMAFGGKLALVAEHTWGLDVKTHLNDWGIYEQTQFLKARNKENFQKIEASWREQRNYIDQAVDSLPAELAEEASDRLKTLTPVKTDLDGCTLIKNPDERIKTNHFEIAFDSKTGAMTTLIDRKTKRNWAGIDHPLFLFEYQTFSPEDYHRFMDQYLTNRPDWALKDYGKTGFEAASPVGHTFLPRLENAYIKTNTSDVRIYLAMDVPGTTHTGCPRQIITELTLPSAEPTIHVAFKRFDKPAFRLPESLWLSCVSPVPDTSGYTLDKMGHNVSPLDVISKGNRSLHGIIETLNYQDPMGSFNLESPDAFLVAPGDKKLLNFDDLQPDMSKGFHFCLCNNVWGTNFVMWFEDNMQFRFKLTFQQV